MVAAMPVQPLACSAVLTHHWLVRRRGGEKVLEALAELVPGADVYTLVHDPAGYEFPHAGVVSASSRSDSVVSASSRSDSVVSASSRSESVAPVSNRSSQKVHTSLLQRIPGAVRHYPKLLPLMPRAARALRLPEVDLV